MHKPALVVGLALVTRIAHADPDPDAIANIGWAFQSCEVAQHSSKRLVSAMTTYKEYRDKAFAIDASIKTWTGKAGDRAVQDYLKTCEPLLQKALDADAAQHRDEAKQRMIDGLRDCIYALEARDCNGHLIASGEFIADRTKSYREAVDGALKADPDLARATLAVPFDNNYNSDCAKPKLVGTRTATGAELVAHCNAELPKRLERAKRDEKTEAASDAAEEKKLRAQARGDRATLLRSKGFPNYWGTGDSDDEVPMLQAGWWRYYEGDCEATLRFAGNKVKAVEATPPRCFGWR